MNGIHKWLVLTSIIFLTYPAASKAEICWADKVISYSSQNEDNKFSAEQALGKPSTLVNNKVMPTAWMPKLNFNEVFEHIHLQFDCDIKAKKVVINSNIGKSAIHGVNVIDENSNEINILRNSEKIDSSSGTLNILLKEVINIRSIKIYVDALNSKEAVQIDAVGISNSDEVYQVKINEIDDEKYSMASENLGYRINSVYSELAPVVSANGERLFFVREDHPENIGAEKKQDIWMSEKDENGRFKEAINLYEPVNNPENNFVISSSVDGKRILLGNRYLENEKMISGFSVSKEVDGKWQFPEDFESPEFKKDGRKISYSFSFSSNILIVSLDREDSEGDTDLYYLKRNENGTWTNLKSLGKDINTAGNESTPFLASDEKTLYFSSNGFPNYGENDIFVSKRLDDSWQNWSEPMNLGKNINTPGWDAYFTITANGKHAYFVSTENSIGGEDIFKIRLPDEISPEEVLLVKGRVLNKKTEDPVVANIIYEDIETGEIIGRSITDENTGSFQLVLQKGKEYGILADAKGYLSVNERIDLSADSIQNNNINKNLFLIPIEKGQKLNLNNIFFEFGKAELDERSNNELNRIAEKLIENNNVEILIKGFTDEIGSDEFNKKLSKQRAKSVYDYLVQKGIDKKRLDYIGKGKIKSIENGKLAKNRKVEFEIIGKNK